MHVTDRNSMAKEIIPNILEIDSSNKGEHVKERLLLEECGYKFGAFFRKINMVWWC